MTSRDENGRPKHGLLRNLFDHMVDTGEFGKLIILSNTDATPTTDFASIDSSEFVFGEHEEADRPGLLIEITEGQADEGPASLEQNTLFE